MCGSYTEKAEHSSASDGVFISLQCAVCVTEENGEEKQVDRWIRPMAALLEAHLSRLFSTQDPIRNDHYIEFHCTENNTSSYYA